MEKITLTSKTRQCVSQNSFLGYEGENQANKLVFEFTDGFKDGLGQLNLRRGETLGYVSLDKVGETYEFPVKSSILSQVGDIEFQVVITENNGTVTKYDKFIMTVKDAIDTDAEMPEEYPSWVDMANEKLAEVDEAISNVEDAIEKANNVADELLQAKENGEFNGKDGVDGLDGKDGVSPIVKTEQIEGGAKITITDVDGTHEVNLSNGKDGIDGQDGKSPTATVEETTTGAKITITDVNGTTTANIYNGKDGADGEGGGIANETDPLYTADKAKLALKSEIPTNLSELNNDEGFIKSYTETDPVYLADKPNLAFKTDIPDITTKQDTLVSGENIKTINGESILGSGNIVIEGGSGGGSSSGYKQVELLDNYKEFTLKQGATILNSELTLNDDVAKYDEVIFIFDLYNGNGYSVQSQFPKFVSSIKYNTSSAYGNVNDGSNFMITTVWNGSSVVSCASVFSYFKNGTTVAIGYTAGNNSTFTKVRFVSVLGIKY